MIARYTRPEMGRIQIGSSRNPAIAQLANSCLRRLESLFLTFRQLPTGAGNDRTVHASGDGPDSDRKLPQPRHRTTSEFMPPPFRIPVPHFQAIADRSWQ